MTLTSRKTYINNLVVSTLKSCKRIKEVTVKFRANKFTSAATSWAYETPRPTIIFSNYWIERLSYTDLRNLVLHECAHIISRNGHTPKFRSTCCRIGVERKWRQSYTEEVELK